jgi:hypothetical protein
MIGHLLHSFLVGGFYGVLVADIVAMVNLGYIISDNKNVFLTVFTMAGSFNFVQQAVIQMYNIGA